MFKGNEIVFNYIHNPHKREFPEIIVNYDNKSITLSIEYGLYNKVDFFIVEGGGQEIGIDCSQLKNSLIFLDVKKLNIDYASYSPNRKILSRFLECLEGDGVFVQDALVDSSGIVQIIALTDQITNKSAEFFYKENAIKLNFSTATDVMRKKVIISGGFYERPMLEHIVKNYSNGDLIDIGANIGNHTVFFSKIINNSCNVHSFEPGDAALSILKDNIDINKSKKVIIHPVALGSLPSKGYLEDWHSTNLGAVRIKSHASDNSKEVNILTLDMELQNCTNISVIKIDVEGMELDVLKGAKNILSKHSPDLYIEAAKESFFKEIELYLEAYGYQFQKTFNDTPTHFFRNK